MKILGIDEAGRGPVVGPLVICGACFEEGQASELKKLGVKDSKLVTPAKRKGLFQKIIDLSVSHKLEIVSAQEIDSRASVSLNLNELEALKAAQIIDELKPDVVFVDSPTSPDATKFEKMIRKHLKNQEVDIHAEWKADFNHPECSAASILAKVTRDEEIEKIKKEVGEDFGSGYAADPITIEFVKAHWENTLAKYIRKSWGTIKQLEKAKGQKTLDGFER